MAFHAREFPMPATVQEIDLMHPYPRAYAHQIYCAYPLTGEVLRASFWQFMEAHYPRYWGHTRISGTLLMWYSRDLLAALTPDDMNTVITYDPYYVWWEGGVEDHADICEATDAEIHNIRYGQSGLTFRAMPISTSNFPVLTLKVAMDMLLSQMDWSENLPFEPSMKYISEHYDELSRATYIYSSWIDGMLINNHATSIPHEWYVKRNHPIFCIYDDIPRSNDVLTTAVYFSSIKMILSIVHLVDPSQDVRAIIERICIATGNISLLKAFLLDSQMERAYRHFVSISSSMQERMHALLSAAKAYRTNCPDFDASSRGKPEEHVYVSHCSNRMISPEIIPLPLQESVV
jgi:hypothetical protein